MSKKNHSSHEEERDSVEESAEDSESSKKKTMKPAAQEKPSEKNPLALWWSKKYAKPVVWGMGTVIVVIVAGLIWWSQFPASDAKDDLLTNTSTNDAAENEEVIEVQNIRKIDGKLLPANTNPNEHPIAIMMENLAVPEVRPQKGLSVASSVYETLAEGGITRFLAVFVPADMPTEIFPVRSARPYYLDFAAEYDAAYAHAGGSPEALSAIQGLDVKDINALSAASRFFWRGPGYAPHNLYTSKQLMEFALRDFGWKDPVYDAWTFADAPEVSARPAAQKITIDWASGTAYDAVYDYDPQTNTYLRSHGATPHKDGNTNEQIRVTNLLIQRIPRETLLPSGKGRLNLDVTGEGEGYVIRNGVVVPATWKKADRKARLRFYDAAGEEISLTRGNTWIHVVPGDRGVTAE